MVGPEDAGGQEVGDHNVHCVMIMGEEDADNADRRSGPGRPVKPPPSPWRVCRMYRAGENRMVGKPQIPSSLNCYSLLER